MESRGILTVWQNVSHVLSGHQDALLENARKGSSASWFPACTAEGPATVFLGSALFFCKARCCLPPMILTALSVMPDLPEAWARDSG